jgi:outer membrane protein TolC
MFKNKMILLSLSLLLSLQTAFAQLTDVHLRLSQEAESVLLAKDNALNLNQIKEMVAGDNVDLQIAYENLYQAQKKVGLARAQYFPYGIGTVAQMYFNKVWGALIAVELVTSIPSKFYNVQKEKNLRAAQYYNFKSLRENIRNEVATMYFTLAKEEAMLKLAELELQLLENLMVVTQEQIELGLATEDDTFKVKMRLLQLRDEYLVFKSYWLAEKAAFNLMLAKTPAEGKKIAIQPLGNFLSQDQFSMDVQAMTDAALNRSYEIVAADYMITAAHKAKRSTQWSIISFDGIGFDYYGRVKIASSKVNEAILRRQLTEENLVNAVYVTEGKLRNAIDFFHAENQLYLETKLYMQGKLAQFKAGDIALDELLEAQMLYLRDMREMVEAHYQAHDAVEDLKRVVLGNVDSSLHTASDVEFNVYKRRRSMTVTLGGNINPYDVKMVSYEFQNSNMHDMVSFSSKSAFAIKLKGFNSVVIKGMAKIVLNNGEVVRKEFTIK